MARLENTLGEPVHDPSPFIVDSPDLGPAMPVTGAPIRDMIVVGAVALALGLALLVLANVLRAREDGQEPSPDAESATNTVHEESATESSETAVNDVIGQASPN